MNTQDMSAIGPIPRKATVPLDRPHTSMPRAFVPSLVRRFTNRVPASLRIAEVRTTDDA